MGISFSGRIVPSDSLQFLAGCIRSNDATLFLKICETILGNFRDAIEGKNTPDRNAVKLPLGLDKVAEYGHHYNASSVSINLDFASAIKDSQHLDSRDLLLGSLGHELGHFYVHRIYGLDKIHPMWEELLADFMGGFLFSLDQDNNPNTADLQINGSLEFFVYCNKVNCLMYPDKVKPIPELGPEYFYEPLDGIHPFCAARNLAIRMGFQRGAHYAITYNFNPQTHCVGLNALKQLFEEFVYHYQIAFNNDQKLQTAAQLLAQYNQDPSKAFLPREYFI